MSWERGGPFDTIWAPAAPKGSAPRAIVRISGPQAFEAASTLVRGGLPRRRGFVEAPLSLPTGGLEAWLPAYALLFPGPRSYTGEDLIELQLPGGPFVPALVGAALEDCGVRAAGPGEFTRRAYVNGRLDLRQAEAVCAWIRAEDERELAAAGAALAGGARAGLDGVRARLLDLVALLEAGLDFEDGETGEVPAELWLPALEDLARDLASTALPGEAVEAEAGLPSFVVVGPPNAGKTSLVNALAEPDEAGPGLVAPLAGTTRDLIWRRLKGAPVRIADSAGIGGPDEDREGRALLRRALSAADGWLWLEAPPPGREPVGPPGWLPGDPLLRLRGKADLAPPPGGSRAPGPAAWWRVSARSGEGLVELAGFLARTGSRETRWTRLQARLEGTRRRLTEACARALAAARAGLGPECVAEELRAGLAILDEDRAAHLPEEILDRIFGSFCLGK